MDDKWYISAHTILHPPSEECKPHMHSVAFDIETIPTAQGLAALPFPREAEVYVEKEHGSLKDPDKIREWKEKQRALWDQGLAKERAEWSERQSKLASTNPRLGRILAASIAPMDSDDPPSVLYALTDEEEAGLVAGALDHLASTNRIVTWNGHFDLRFLLVRAVKLRVPLPLRLHGVTVTWLNRYRMDWHVDLKLLLCEGDKFSPETLDDWCQFCGIPGKTNGMTGADVYPKFLSGAHSDIVGYSAGDVAAIRSLARVAAPTFGVDL